MSETKRRHHQKANRVAAKQHRTTKKSKKTTKYSRFYNLLKRKELNKRIFPIIISS